MLKQSRNLVQNFIEHQYYTNLCSIQRKTDIFLSRGNWNVQNYIPVGCSVNGISKSTRKLEVHNYTDDPHVMSSGRA